MKLLSIFLSWLPHFALSVCFIACTGAVGDAGKPDGDEGNAPAPTDLKSATPEACAKSTQPGPSPVRRLNRFEYNSTVKDLLGDTTNPAMALPIEEIGNGFGNDASALGVSSLLAEGYLSIAKGIAGRLISDRKRYDGVLGCEPAKGEEECAKKFIASFAMRAFRRPPDDTERDLLFALFQKVRAATNFDTAAQAVVTATLQLPQFLYRVEFGTPLKDQPGVSKLNDWEIASRLSYMLWGTMPDDILFAEARAGRLATKEQIRKQALRMIDDPRTREIVNFFHSTLFGLLGLDRLSKNSTTFPKFFPELGSLLRREAEQLIETVTWEGTGTYAEMLTAPYSFMNGKLAAFYGVSGPTTDAFEKVALDSARHAGFMSSAGIMTALTPGTETNPVLRGLYVSKKLLCDPPPDPPPALAVSEPEPLPGLTTRERFAAHQTAPSCKGCHLLLDPLGYGFEHFDAIGLWREMDNGKPVDDRGKIEGTDVEGTFQGVRELMDKLAKSEQVADCLSNNWMSFGYGRGFDEQADACNMSELHAAFRSSGGNVRSILLALTQTDAFAYRITPQP